MILLESISSERLRTRTASRRARVELAGPARAGQRAAPGLHVHKDLKN